MSRGHGQLSGSAAGQNLVISAIAFDFFCRLFNLLPLKISGFLGRRLGDLIYILGIRKKTAKKNMQRASGIDFSPRLLRNCYRHFGQVAVEFMLLKSRQGELSKHHKIEGREYLERAFSRGNGVIIYTAHLGNWEWLGGVLAELGYPVTAIARTQKNAALNSRINNLRRRQGVRLVDRKKGVRESIRVLKNGELLIIIGDQHASSGLPLKFMGRKASVHRGAVHMASRYGVPVLPVYSHRKDFASYTLDIKPEVDIPRELEEVQEKKWLKDLVKTTEIAIKDNPEQWMWMHRRWKLD